MAGDPKAAEPDLSSSQAFATVGGLPGLSRFAFDHRTFFQTEIKWNSTGPISLARPAVHHARR
jgi:hypothetical protein